MKRKIIRVGNSYGIIIPKHLLKFMDWNVDFLDAQIDTVKKQLVIRKK
jgi:antitoxin component of MazEF toxin-antitoxin module